ncbi:nitrate reductase associated protein [Microcystis aeruginosa CS-564/01]|uniref:nitrate reductase associated protein n=1 Tax=Microcystis aeruginosa TaxID=1126 RepID=UPI00232DBE8B|nr:nitrate reductase associated protein [Microcystis aeruginosa]MDB9426288.1 nitrate reductase associated protein [Microcystis aeruginosa CS-564/01]
MTTFFEFEAEFVDSLRCIPMAVRMKLDTCGVKLKLSHWMQLTQPERMVLVNMACTTAAETKIYRDFLQKLITEKTGNPAGELAIDPHPPWLDDSQIPDTVLEKARELEIEISLEQWKKLQSFQRFALIKLSRPSHENLNFYPALKEFHIVDA